jgi:membrane glycosyltransferase
VRAHAGHTVFGVALALTALLLSKELFYWLLPITIGLMLSIPLSWLSGGARRTKWIKTVGLLRAPEEKNPVSILVELKTNLEKMPYLQHMHPFSRLVNNPQLLKWHLDQLPVPVVLKPKFYAPRIIAEWKLHHAESLQQLESWLEPAEVVALLSKVDYLEKLKIIGK